MSQVATSVHRRGRRSATSVVIGSAALVALLIAPAPHAQSREERSPDVILATGAGQQSRAQSAPREERSPDVILATGAGQQSRAHSAPREERSPDVILAGRDTGPAPLPSPIAKSSGELDWGYVAIGALGLIGLLGAVATTRHRRGRQRGERRLGIG